MNKKIAAVAVAGLFAAPAVALAQSSVTISGQLKGGMENLKYSNTSIAGKSSQYGIVDDSSRIIFNVREDLGGGLAAIGQMDIRIKPDDLQGGGQPNGNIVQGNSHMGLQSKSWGRIFIGRQDLHYFNTSGNISGKNSLRADSISLLAFAGQFGAKGAATGGVAIANASRTQNVVHYTTPNWGGFTGIIAYSSNAAGTDVDIGSGVRKGYAWSLNPNYSAANWQVGYSFYTSKPDGGNTAAVITNSTQLGGTDQKSNRLYGNYTFGFGLKVGLAWDNSKLEGNGANDGRTLSKRTVWSIPFQYSFMGKHQITGHYTWAKDDTGSLSNGLSTGSKMWAIGYSYDLSKRTSVGLTYAKINNDSNEEYNFFTATSLGVGGPGAIAGSDPRMFGTTFRHAF